MRCRAGLPVEAASVALALAELMRERWSLLRWRGRLRSGKLVIICMWNCQKFPYARIVTVEHHQAHAASAYYAVPRPRHRADAGPFR